MNDHIASIEITVNLHESVLSRKLVFWTSNRKHVIKYDLYVKFSRIFAHNVQMCAKFCCKNFSDVCQVFRMLNHYSFRRGAFFSWTRCILTCAKRLTNSQLNLPHGFHHGFHGTKQKRVMKKLKTKKKLTRMLAINVPIPNRTVRPPGAVPIATTTVPERATNRCRG